MPPPSPRPACSNLRRRVSTWVSTERGPPLKGGQAMRNSSWRLRTRPGGINRAQSRANSRGLNSTGWSRRVTWRSSRCTSSGPTQTRSCRPLPLRRSKLRQRAASSSRPKGLRKTSSAPASSRATTGSAPVRAVSTITGVRSWAASRRAELWSNNSALMIKSGVCSSHRSIASAAVATAAAKCPSWRRRWASTVRRVGWGSTTRTRLSAPSPSMGTAGAGALAVAVAVIWFAAPSNRISMSLPRLSANRAANWYQAMPCNLSSTHPKPPSRVRPLLPVQP